MTVDGAKVGNHRLRHVERVLPARDTPPALSKTVCSFDPDLHSWRKKEKSRQ